MLFRTELSVERSSSPLTYADRIVATGSCFAAHMGAFFSRYQFRTLINPFGVMYNPLSLHNTLWRLTENPTNHDLLLTEHDGLWHSLQCDSRFSSLSRADVLQKYESRLKTAQDFVKTSTCWMLTLGTARVYVHKQSNQVVANCHKLPQDQFDRRLLSAEEIVRALKEIIAMRDALNPRITIIWSVSPVRHLKEGFHANTLSKSLLHIALKEVVNPRNRSYYFPAYELLTDDLRDYRFYADDLTHPSSSAISYIWRKLKEAWIAEDAQKVIRKVEKIQRGLEHRPNVADHPGYDEHRKRILQRIRKLQEVYPFMSFDSDK